LFDERFFLYFFEVDFCLRAGRAGWATVVVPDIRVEQTPSPAGAFVYHVTSDGLRYARVSHRLRREVLRRLAQGLTSLRVVLSPRATASMRAAQVRRLGGLARGFVSFLLPHDRASSTVVVAPFPPRR